MEEMKPSEKEFKKAWKDAKKNGWGVYEPFLKKRIEANKLVFISSTGKKVKAKPRTEVQLRQNLMAIKKVYNEKFKKCTNPYCLSLFKKDEGLFVERLIRAVEICTLSYILNTGEGSLNLNKRMSIVKGRRSFLWEY